jgi:hypothetical protein
MAKLILEICDARASQAQEYADAPTFSIADSDIFGCRLPRSLPPLTRQAGFQTPLADIVSGYIVNMGQSHFVAGRARRPDQRSNAVDPV